jgi:hypothetical protein
MPTKKNTHANLRGKHKASLDKRTKLLNLLKPHEVSRYQLQSKHNPDKTKVRMIFGDNEGESHVVPFYVRRDNAKIFKYRGRLYDASKMTANVKKKILRLME